MDDLTRARMRRELGEVERLFDLAPRERAAALDAMEREDASLGAGVRELLAYADEEHGAHDASDDSPGSRAGTVVSGRFLLLRLLGSGGMGEVYLARRTDDVDRQVALKLMRGDLPIPIERARRERHILARLVHPNIAGLVDAGLADSGQPWFAMEYVDGESLTDWCDHQALDLRARVRLFAQVCRAVQFAHRNLVLHRDLKPSNILVDREGVPKLLDFGVAKLLDVTDSRQTQTLAMTPAYAAPEQLRGEVATTASDVYQLGLVLYELLAGVGARHARASDTRRAHPDRLLPRLDHALTTLATRDHAAAQAVACVRGLGIDKLRRSLRGDLGRIVAKATADDVQERYVTAQALAEDLDRWADGLPVAAHRGSFAYRVSKLLRRHAIASAAIALLALGLVAVSVIAVNRAERERLQREHAETLLGFMNDVFAQADPQNSEGRNLSAAELLERASANLDARSDLDDLTRGMLKIQIADTFNSLALFDKALPAALEAVTLLAPGRDRNPDAYLAAVTNALPILSNLERRDESLALIGQALPIARLRASTRLLVEPNLLQYRGLIHMQLDQLRASEDDFREAVRLSAQAGEQGRDVLAFSSNFLGVLFATEGNAIEALRWVRDAAQAAPATAKNAKYNSGMYQYNLADSLITSGHFREAVLLLADLQVRLPKLSGADAILSADRVRRVLARSQVVQGDVSSAVQAISEVVSHIGTYPSEDQKHSLLTHIAAARILLAADRADDADLQLDEAQRIIDSSAHAATFPQLRVDWLRGEGLLHEGRIEDASNILEIARAKAEVAIGGGASWIVGEIDDTLARCSVARGNFTEAVRLFKRATDQFARATGGASPSVLRSEIHALLAHAASGDSDPFSGRLEDARGRLVQALAGSASVPVWQLDVMVAELSTATAMSSTHTDRVASALEGLSGKQALVPSFRRGGGIGSFD